METKSKYITPKIEKIQLDNEISLALASIPPYGPDEVQNKIPEFFNTNPFQSNNC